MIIIYFLQEDNNMNLQESVMFMWVSGAWKSTKAKILSDVTWIQSLSAGEELKSDEVMFQYLQWWIPFPYELIRDWTFKLLGEYSWKKLIFDWFYRNKGSFDVIKEAYPHLIILHLPTEIQIAHERIMNWERGRDDDEDSGKVLERITSESIQIDSLLRENPGIIQVNSSWWIDLTHARVVEALSGSLNEEY